MATLDFTPLVRSSIGFDQLPGLLAHALERPETTYPPYNIEKVGEDQYRIVWRWLASAGTTWSSCRSRTG
jgi:molecular chaperone IbpA